MNEGLNIADDKMLIALVLLLSRALWQ